MSELQPGILIGIGHRARRAVQQFVCRLAEYGLEHTCMLPLVIDWAQAADSSQPIPEGLFRFVLAPPSFDGKAWPGWLPTELLRLDPAQRDHTRAWIKAAFHQQADEIGSFLVERIPHLSALDTVARLGERGHTLAAGNEIAIYVLADLADLTGNSVFIESACLADQVCRQLGLRPHTGGLLFLPGAPSSVPADESTAYAALKELEYANTAGKWGEKLATTALPGVHRVSEAIEPFDAGCYLLDMVNEAGYTLQKETQQIDIAAEWLYAMTIGGVARPLQARLSPRYRTARLGGKSRCYAGLGLTVRYVPTQTLGDWAATRLSADLLACILDTQPQTEIEKHAGALIERLGLSAEVLQSRLEHQHIPNIDAELSPLLNSLPGQIEQRTRRALESVREKHLPQIKNRLEYALTTNLDEIRREIDHALSILLEDVPLGGVNAAREFLRVLRSRVAEQQTVVQARRQGHSAQLKRSLDTVSSTFYALRTARMRLPPWPVAALWILTVIGMPLMSGVQLVYAADAEVYRGVLVWLFGGVILVLGLWATQLYRQVRQVNRRHADLVRERFALESAPLITKMMQSLYVAVQSYIDLVEKRHMLLLEEIRQVLQRLRADQAQHAQALSALTGPGVRQSVVDLECAGAFYRQMIVEEGNQRRIRALAPFHTLAMELIRQAGPVSTWQDGDGTAQERIRTRILAVSREMVDKRLARLKIADLLSTEETTRWPALVESALEAAQPWWNLKTAAVRRIKTQRVRLIGGSGEHIPDEVIAIPSTDPYTLIALTVHWGLPLLAISRIDDYRLHYVDALRHSNYPLHSTAALLLVDDPLTPHRRGQLPSAMLFAAALALGIARRDVNGDYLLPYDRKSWVRLSAERAHAVALMSMNDHVCWEVQKRLSARVAEKGAAAIQAILDEYMAVVPDLEDWQVRAIIDLERAWGWETETDLDL